VRREFIDPFFKALGWDVDNELNLRDDPAPAFQLRRYAWTAKLPMSILTDFEEFIVYDTRIRPDEKDAPSTGRILYISYEEYWLDTQAVSGSFSNFNGIVYFRILDRNYLLGT
jgi:hypothetical protein